MKVFSFFYVQLNLAITFGVSNIFTVEDVNVGIIPSSESKMKMVNVPL
uniref:Uncharacterized protein n=1 Tax=Lepeophtheirus salmonis TaxID=72036 RepID=A0A0K2VD34_LEPSM